MRRREFITLLGGGAVAAWPLTARAQRSGNFWRLGFLGPSLDVPSMSAQYQEFLIELRRLGFSEGQNLIVEYRRLDDARGPFLAAAELIRPQVDLVVAVGPEIALQAVVAASSFVPIVILAVQYDPVERGYVTSLARPGGNITGVFYRSLELAQKQLELLAEAFPKRTRLAVLWDEGSADQFNAAELTAKSLPLELRSLKLEKPPYDFDAAFRTLAQDASQMVLVLSSPFFAIQRPRIAELATQNRLPTMFVFKPYVTAGGLMSCGVDQILMYRRAADYVARILKGAKATDLPIEQATKFELVVNLKAAKAIGVTLPTSILLRADEVIE
jgi:ABC-type uncharacterized transport system substrate-binding protein